MKKLIIFGTLSVILIISCIICLHRQDAKAEEKFYRTVTADRYPKNGYLELEFSLSGCTPDQKPILYCEGSGISSKGHPFKQGEVAVFTGSPGLTACNIKLADGSWLVNAHGVKAGYILKVNGVTIFTGRAIGTTEAMYLFEAGIPVELYGEIIPTY